MRLIHCSHKEVNPKVHNVNKPLIAKRRVLLAGIIALALTACATPPRPSPIASLPVDPETASTLHIYRSNSGNVGAALDNEVYLDGVMIGLLPPASKLSAKVVPGTHEIFILPRMKIIGTTSEKSYKLAVTVGAKETKYIRYNVAIGRIVFYGTTAVADDLTSLTEVTEYDWKLLR